MLELKLNHVSKGGSKSLYETMLDYSPLDFWEQILVKSETKHYNFLSRKCDWKTIYKMLATLSQPQLVNAKMISIILFCQNNYMIFIVIRGVVLPYFSEISFGLWFDWYVISQESLWVKYSLVFLTHSGCMMYICVGNLGCHWFR